MKLLLKRTFKSDTYTVGKLYIDGKYFSNTLEDRDRGLDQKMSIEQINKLKVYGETAIPIGTYKITLDVVSPKFRCNKYYRDFCDGKMPRLMNVPGYNGVLIHPLNTAEESLGCIGVGINSQKGRITNSRSYFERLYGLMRESASQGQEITITIV